MGTESNMRPSLLSSDFFLYFGTSVNPGFGNKITSFSVGASDRVMMIVSFAWKWTFDFVNTVVMLIVLAVFFFGGYCYYNLCSHSFVVDCIVLIMIAVVMLRLDLSFR